MFRIVLVEPEIPPNTGNVIRLAANTGCELHLVEPLGFSMDDKHMRRAGLDYHEYASVQRHASWQAFLDAMRPDATRMFAFTTRGSRPFAEIAWRPGDWLVFGAETRGLAPELRRELRGIAAGAPADARGAAQPQPLEHRRGGGVRGLATEPLFRRQLNETLGRRGFRGGKKSMNRRLAIFELAQCHGLTPVQVRGLIALREPAADSHTEANALLRATGIAAAALVGLGIVLWIAANWAEIGRTGKFALLQAVIIVMALAGLARSSSRLPALLLAFLGQGAVLAFFGQTYQTGADPWQLFALWAFLGLPWCLAARSQVLWAPWTLVAAVATSLWVHAHQGWRWLTDQPSTNVHLLGWLAVFALAALSFPWPTLRRRLGTGDWSLRLGIVLAAVMVLFSALPTLFGGELRLIYGLAFICLLAVAATMALPRARDVFALCTLGLAIDALLVAALARWLFKDAGADWLGPLFLLGCAAALLVAGTIAVVMRLAGRNASATGADDTAATMPSGSAVPSLQRWLAAATAQGLLPPAAAEGMMRRTARPWPVVLLAFLGAQLAAWPLIAFFATLIGPALIEGVASYFIGPLLVLGACVVLRGRVARLFVEHLALIALLVGLGVLCLRLMRDLGDSVGGLASAAVMLAVAFLLPMAWVRAILGASAAGTVFFAFTHMGWFEGRAPLFWAGMSLALAWAAALVMQSRAVITSGRWRLAAVFESTQGGWLMAALVVLALASGMSLLVGGMFGPSGALGFDASTDSAAARADSNWMRWLSWPSAISVACVLAAWSWCATRAPQEAHGHLLRSPVGLLALGVTALLAAFMPALGPVAALGTLAFATGRPWQASAALLAAVWVVGAFYYSLAWELPTKALVLVVAGSALGAATWLLRPRPAKGGQRQAALALPGAAAWTVTGLLATLAVVNTGIWQKENIIARGRPVFLELAPVDPRSLMQGDFMALNYRLGAELRKQLDQTSTLQRPRAVARIDERGIASLDRLAPSDASAGEVVVELTPKDGRWIVASDAWFFREGNGQRFQQARYGEFRVDPQGRALLVGLADAQLRRIEP